MGLKKQDLGRFEDPGSSGRLLHRRWSLRRYTGNLDWIDTRAPIDARGLKEEKRLLCVECGVLCTIGVVVVIAAG